MAGFALLGEVGGSFLLARYVFWNNRPGRRILQLLTIVAILGFVVAEHWFPGARRIVVGTDLVALGVLWRMERIRGGQYDDFYHDAPRAHVFGSWFYARFTGNSWSIATFCWTCLIVLGAFFYFPGYNSDSLLELTEVQVTGPTALGPYLGSALATVYDRPLYVPVILPLALDQVVKKFQKEQAYFGGGVMGSLLALVSVSVVTGVALGIKLPV